MRILQVGAGRWGRNHVRSWERLGVELSVCDSDPAALAELAVPTTEDVSAALDAVDAIDVVTPADSHPALVREALERGKDVFVEKPFTPEPGEAFALQALAEERGRIVQVGHVFRFAPVAQAVKHAIDAGRIGEPRYLQGHFMGFKRPRSDGGAAISDGIHWVDLASWLLGRQPELATATLRDSLGRGMDDVALLLRDVGQERDHVVAHLSLDLGHPARIHGGLAPDLLQRIRRDQAALRVHLADRELNVEPAAVASPPRSRSRLHLAAARSVRSSDHPTRRNT